MRLPRFYGLIDNVRGDDDAFRIEDVKDLDFLLVLLRSYLPAKHYFFLSRWPFRKAVQEVLDRFVSFHVRQGERPRDRR